MKKILYFIALGVGLLSACEKGELVETTVYEKITPADPKYSYIKVINLTPAATTVKFNYFLDGTKLSAGYSTSGVENAGYGYNSVFPDLGYTAVTPGAHTVTAKIIPSTTVDESFNTSINAEAGKYFTLITTGEYNATTKKIPSSILVQDVSPALDTSKVFVRVLNMYNGGPAVDLTMTSGTGTKLLTNVAVGSASGWAEVPSPGQGTAPTVKYYLNTTGTTTPLITAGTSYSFTKGRAYTIYLIGVKGNTTYPLGIGYYTTFF